MVLFYDRTSEHFIVKNFQKKEKKMVKEFRSHVSLSILFLILIIEAID